MKLSYFEETILKTCIILSFIELYSLYGFLVFLDENFVEANIEQVLEDEQQGI